MNSGFPAWILVGPTASGKTEVAHCLARRHGYELLSADSMLVYRGLEIGTAKPTLQERQGLRYHGLDLAPPSAAFSVADFLARARAAFQDCAARGGRMLVVGGTGLYVRALWQGLNAAPPPDAARRAVWAERLARAGVGALQAAVEARAPGILRRMPDPRNPRRLMRLLERLEQGAEPLPGPPPTAAPAPDTAPDTAPPIPALAFAPDALAERIARRVERMFAAGLLDEVRALLERFPTWSDTAQAAIGYAEARAVLEGRLTETAARERMAARTRQLAKRQRTWYRHQLPVAWIDGPADAADVGRAADAVAAHWRQHGPHTVLRS